MSSKNNETSPELGFMVVGIAFMGLLLFAFAAFISLCLTVLSLIAWNNPLKLGSNTIQPHEARAFVYSGIAGIILLSLFAEFCSFLFDFRIPSEYWPYVLLGGYTGGSLLALSGMTEEPEEQAENQIIRQRYPLRHQCLPE